MRFSWIWLVFLVSVGAHAVPGFFSADDFHTNRKVSSKADAVFEMIFMTPTPEIPEFLTREKYEDELIKKEEDPTSLPYEFRRRVLLDCVKKRRQLCPYYTDNFFQRSNAFVAEKDSLLWTTEDGLLKTVRQARLGLKRGEPVHLKMLLRNHEGKIVFDSATGEDKAKLVHFTSSIFPTKPGRKIAIFDLGKNLPVESVPKLAKEEASLNESLYSIGFHSKTKNRDDNAESGKAKVTWGRNLDQDRALNKIDSKARPPFTSSDIIYVDMDATSEAPGSPVFNGKGDVYGIITNVVADKDDKSKENAPAFVTVTKSEGLEHAFLHLDAPSYCKIQYSVGERVLKRDGSSRRAVTIFPINLRRESQIGRIMRVASERYYSGGESLSFEARWGVIREHVVGTFEDKDFPRTVGIEIEYRDGHVTHCEVSVPLPK